MPISQEYESILGFATTLVALAGIAVIGRTVAGAMFHHSIPWEAKKPLIDKYGLWAVNRSEAFCGEGDVACVEREAKRLYKVTKYRR